MKNSGDFRKPTKSMISHRLGGSAGHANESPTRGETPPLGSACAVLGPETNPTAGVNPRKHVVGATRSTFPTVGSGTKVTYKSSPSCSFSLPRKKTQHCTIIYGKSTPSSLEHNNSFNFQHLVKWIASIYSFLSVLVKYLF